jgi:signal transduction histidine kinase
MSQSKGIGSLINNKLFAGIDPKGIKLNLLQSNFLPFKEGDIIFQTGDKSEYLYLILDGEIKLKIHSSMNSSIVRVKEKNDFFGDLELLESTPRKSSAVANNDSVLYKLSQKELLNLISRYKSIEETLSTEKTDNTVNIKNSSYQIKQTSEITFDDIPAALPPAKEIDVPAENLHEDTDLNQGFGNDSENNNYNLTSPEPEELQLAHDSEPPIIADDEDFSEGSIFSAALDGDLEFQEETAPEEIPFIEEEQVSITPQPEIINPVEEQESNEFTRKEEDIPVEETADSGIDYQKMFYAVRKIQENAELDKTVRSIIEALFSLFDAQIARIFHFDKSAAELWSFPFMDNTGEIKKVKTGEGLIGRCASDNEIINISNPANDSRFNYQIDAVENITSEDMILFPVHDNEKNVAAVIQMINSGRDGFTKQDEDILNILSVDIYKAIEKTAPKHTDIEKNDLIQLEKMTDFIIDDINAPLTLINRYAEFIRKKTGIKEVKQVSEFITEQSNSILTYAGIVSDFINGRNSLKRKVLDLNITLNNILDMFAEYVELRHAKLFKKLDIETKIFLDPDAFYQVCFQLIKKACDAMPDGGNLYIISKNEGTSVSIEFRDRIKESDDGIKDEAAKTIVMPGNEQNDDLGLAIANKIVKDHGGEIKLDSESSEGICFIILLPVR